MDDRKLAKNFSLLKSI